MTRFLSLIVVIAACAAVFAVSPAHAQDAQNSASPAVPAPDDSQSDFLKPHNNPRLTQPGTAKPLPADTPKTEKHGDDLTVHAPGGDYTVPGFLKDIPPGEGRPLNIVTQEHGNCTIQVDGNGVVITMKCEK